MQRSGTLGILKKKTNILSAEGQRAAPGFGAERFKKLGYSNVGNALELRYPKSDGAGIRCLKVLIIAGKTIIESAGGATTRVGEGRFARNPGLKKKREAHLAAAGGRVAPAFGAERFKEEYFS